MHLSRTPLLLLAVFVTSLSLSGCASNNQGLDPVATPTTPQEWFNKAVTESDGIEVNVSASQNSCAEGSLKITGQARLEAPEIGELYQVITTVCDNAGALSGETAEVLHWRLSQWQSIATIGMSNVVWNVTGDCAAAESTTVTCPVKLEPNPTRPETGNLVVTRDGEGFTAEIIYSS